MKVFVTGGTGFIGSHFINQAHDLGIEVTALRRGPSSKPRVRLRIEPLWVEEAGLDARAFENVGTFVHLAAHSANLPYDTLENCLLENVIKPLATFRTAIAAGVRRFIIAGSCFEYGRAGERYDRIPPSAPVEPMASYPASKAAATAAFHALACEERLEMLFLRVFQVYGEGELATRFWPSLRKAALLGQDFEMSEGLQVRDFIPVEDVAGAFVSALSRNNLRPGFPVMENLATGREKTLAQFAREEWQKFGAKGRLLIGAKEMRTGEVLRFVPQLPPYES